MRRTCRQIYTEIDLLCIHISHIFAPVNLWTIISQNKYYETHKSTSPVGGRNDDDIVHHEEYTKP